MVLASSATTACWTRPELGPPAGGRMTSVPEPPSVADIDSLLAAMRPRLHRYCARMVGSVIDGEDVLQDALIKAVEAQAGAGNIGNPEGWLFRIAHNTALDFLRRRNRQEALRGPAEVDMMVDQLDLVSRTRLHGKAEVSRYFGNYSKVSDWHLVPGLVEGRPAILVFDPNEQDPKPKYFMLLAWTAGKVANIRDFRHAPYVLDGAEYLI